MNSPDELSSQEVKDWVTFFKQGHFMTEEEVTSTIKTPEVLQAFERAKIRKLPREVKQAYLQEDLKYNEYSEHTAKLVEESKRVIALNLIKISNFRI